MITAENNRPQVSDSQDKNLLLIEKYQEKIEFLNSDVVDPFVFERVCADAPFRPGNSPAGSNRHQAFRKACQRFYEEKIRVLETEATPA